MAIVPKIAIIICVGLLLLALILFVFDKVADSIHFVIEYEKFMNHTVEEMNGLDKRVENIEEALPALYNLKNENDISSEEYFNSLGLIRKSDILKCKTHLSSRTLKIALDQVEEFDIPIVYWTDIEKICPMTLEEFKKGVIFDGEC